MSNQQLEIGYMNWIFVIILTILFFDLFYKKYNTKTKLALLTLGFTWIVVTIIVGIEKIYFDNEFSFLPIGKFTNLLFENLAIIAVFGGITFGIKYNKKIKIKEDSLRQKIDDIE